MTKHTERGIPFERVIGGILRALDDGQAKFGITYKLIMCFLRHLSEEAAFETLEQAQPWLESIDGVGLDSSEVGHPPAKFARVFAKAREQGLKLVAHAGEEGPPDYVWQALDTLAIDRIDHGNRALEDETLIKRIVEEAYTLTVCPLSNLKLCVIDEIGQSPVKAMLDRGIKATVNSDDPSYFGGYINDNYRAVADALDLGIEDIETLAVNSFEGSFLSEDDKADWVATVRSTAARFVNEVAYNAKPAPRSPRR